jgi:hypothetical protein
VSRPQLAPLRSRLLELTGLVLREQHPGLERAQADALVREWLTDEEVAFAAERALETALAAAAHGLAAAAWHRAHPAGEDQ